MVYWNVITILEESGKGKHYNLEGPVSFNQFKQNLTLQWPDFFEVLKQGIANDTTLREGDPFLGIHGHKTPLRHLPPLCRHVHCIDEAHTLVNSYDEDKESRFVVLCQVLGALSTSSLFLFFLSTAGKVTQFSQPHGQDESDHINCSELVAPHPYITVGCWL